MTQKDDSDDDDDDSEGEDNAREILLRQQAGIPFTFLSTLVPMSLQQGR